MTKNSRTCSGCNGRRTRACDICFGAGKIMKKGKEVGCSGCSGSGQVTCQTCNGAGSV